MARQTIDDATFFAAVRKAKLEGGTNKDAIKNLEDQGFSISDAVFSQRKGKMLNRINESMEKMAGKPNTPELAEKYAKLVEAKETLQLARAGRKSVDIFDDLSGLL